MSHTIRWAVLFLPLILLLPTKLLFSQPAERAFESEAKAQVDRVFATWDKSDSPGCALGIVQNGKLVYQKGYGQANLEHDVPIRPSTVFYIASTSKQFTAASVALLAKQNKLSLDDDIRKYLPELPVYESPVTIRHLIHHTSGIPDYLELLGLAGQRLDDVHGEEEILELLSRQKSLSFKPGDQFLYSNSGYFLLACHCKTSQRKIIGAVCRRADLPSARNDAFTLSRQPHAAGEEPRPRLFFQQGRRVPKLSDAV